MSYQLVWFKRDLRWEDHAALARSAFLGPIRCIYIIEPTLWLQPDMALQHFEFIHESLKDLDDELRNQGGGIEVFTGEALEVFNQIWRTDPFFSLHSHMETGTHFSYQRDHEVAKWCHTHDVNWHEYPQFGVVRGLENRNLWQAAWEAHMMAPIETPTSLRFWKTNPSKILEMAPPKNLTHNPSQRQQGGRKRALFELDSFLTSRSFTYRGGISSPLSAQTSCSRLSAYLAWGSLSMREVVNQTRQKIKELDTPDTYWQKAGLSAFLSRLYWHCHFIQKLESEPGIDWHNVHRGYDGLREESFNHDFFEALKAGKTGWPLVDSCVHMLNETGWLNFRMRAMLVTVAAYPLWLHWRPVGEWLATRFLDYEPGIHWSQLQMQSGTTGINTMRIYNPIKQAQDHDPQGKFVRTWLPYMRVVPDTYLFEPYHLPQSLQNEFGLQVGQHLPSPVVDFTLATRAAKIRFLKRRQLPEVKIVKKQIIDKHSSRKHFSKREKKLNSVAKKNNLELF